MRRILAIGLLLLAACSHEPAAQTPAAPTKGHSAMNITSEAFAPGEPIPRQYTADGEDISPPLAWTGLPDGTRELALVCDDPDAPTPEPWVHWVLYGISPDADGLPEGGVGAAIGGSNSWNTVGYRGPAPPPGHGTHHYHFTLYALDTALKLAPGATKGELLDAMVGHVLDSCELVGMYAR